MKNIEVNNWSSDRQVDDIDLTGLSAFVGSICKKNLTISDVQFWNNCARLSHVIPNPVDLWKKKINFISLLILEILEFHESFTIRSVETMLRDKSRPKIFLWNYFQENQMKNVSKNNVKRSFSLFAKISVKMNFLQKHVLLL